MGGWLGVVLSNLIIIIVGGFQSVNQNCVRKKKHIDNFMLTHRAYS